MKLGNVTIAHPLTTVLTKKGGALAASAFPNDAGGGTLQRFVVTLDNHYSSIFLKPVPGIISDIDTFDRSGMWINVAAGGFNIISRTKGGSTESADLEAGDLIADIDGRSFTESALDVVRQNWRDQQPGTVVTLKIER